MGGLFRQFQFDGNDNSVISESGVRRMAAVQLAINRVNNKSDGLHDNLLQNTQVRDRYIFSTASAMILTVR